MDQVIERYNDNKIDGKWVTHRNPKFYFNSFFKRLNARELKLKMLCKLENKKAEDMILVVVLVVITEDMTVVAAYLLDK